jgi:GT2 family glycosyltransferase
VGIKVSIILPSHNRYPLNLNSLYALENQNFDLSKMEVILVDDSSTDKTPELKKYHPPYHFKYVRTDKKLRSHTRNIGIKNASGEVLIFLDAEMVVDPNFVMNNYKHHHKKDNVVVIGKKNRFYSILYQEFDCKQIKEITGLMRKNNAVKKTIRNKINKNIKAGKLQRTIKNLEKPIRLIKKKDILNFSSLEPYTVFTTNISSVVKHLGNNFDTSPIAWMACFGNLSVKKNLVEKIGGYDEDFKGWGVEDMEFAYRLQKAGAKFIVDNNLKRYHQEHPKQANRMSEDNQNWVLFYQKHPDFAVYIRSINLIQNKDYYFIDKVVREYYKLNNKYPGKYKLFIEIIMNLLLQIRIFKAQNKPQTNILENMSVKPDKLKRIYKQRNNVSSLKKYDNLVNLFDILINQ